VIEGVYSAETEERLRHDLEQQGLCVLSLRPAGLLTAVLPRRPRPRRIPAGEFLVFNQELATLLKAGMPLVQSLDLLTRRVESPVFRGVLQDVYTRVRAGAALSDAFAAHGELLPPVYTASLVAGERSGSLDAVLRRFVEHAKIVATVRRKTISALVYPAILVALAVVLVAIIVLNVIPAFTDFYATFDAELPPVTRAIVFVSNLIRDQFVILALLVAGAVGAVLVWVRAPGRRTQLDRLILAVPVLGEVARKFATTQMARTLATLLGGGLPLVNALDIAARSVGNRFVAGEVAAVARRVREGASLAGALEARQVFPEVAVRMAEVGEATGALQDMLNAVAEFYDEDIATSMERFIALVEPTLLVALGIVIAGLLLALYMPLFQLSSVLG
jgi:type IV pilus assembly protein PilC